MNIQFTISDEMGKELTALQSALGMKGVEDLTIHAWNVLGFLIETIRNEKVPLSPEAIHWISQPTMVPSPTETLQEHAVLSHAEIDTRILEEIHRLLDDDQLDQALKATHILKILKSHAVGRSTNHQVKSEMLLAAAETFAAECDPEKAAQLIIDATHEHNVKTTDRSTDRS
ncbi:hypothetical protein PJI16_14845 [Nitrospira sp. MA-1]|nr:hypothetical protein [Nitrospira sp. MA-1]